MNKPLITLLVLLLGMHVTCFAADLTQKIETSDGFTLYMPSNWSSIPKDVLNAQVETIAKMAPKATIQTPNYGFQLSSAQNWFEYPYIFVQVNHAGRWPESQLKSIKQVSRSFNQGLTEAQDSMPSLVSDAQEGETVYESQTHILWSQFSMDVKNVGTVRVLTGTILTEVGTIGIYAYVKEQDFPRYLPILEAIIRNTAIADDLRYKPRITDSIPVGAGIDWCEALGKALGVTIFFALFGVLIRKKKTSNQPPDRPQ
jgi:hypothetical protein